MLVSLITLQLLLFLNDNKKSHMLIGAFLLGLCISHHQIFILFIPGWVYLIKSKLKKVYADRKLLIKMLILATCGASFYLYAVIASLHHTVLDWTDAKTFQGLIQLILRLNYGSFKAYASSGANILNQISDMISGVVFIFLDFKLLGIILIGFGIVVCKKYAKQFSNFLYISLILHFMFLFYTNFVLSNSFSDGMYERFLIPLYFILIFFHGVGMDYVYKNYFLFIVKKVRNRSLNKFAHSSFFIFFSFFIVLIAYQNFKTISLVAQTKTFDRLGEDLLATVPLGGIFTTQGDNQTFTSYYHLYGLRERKDLVFFQLGLMNKSNYIEMIKKRSPSLIISNPINNNDDFKSFINRNIKKGFYAEGEMSFGAWRPYGLLWKYYPNDNAASSDSNSLLAENKRLWEDVYKMPVLTSEEKNIFHANTVGEFYINAYQNYSELLVAMKQYGEAGKVLKNIAERYKKGDLQSEAMYMNILVLEKKCTDASRVAHKINLADTIKKYPGFVKSALSYLQICDPQNRMISIYKEQLSEYEKKSKTDLNSF